MAKQVRAMGLLAFLALVRETCANLWLSLGRPNRPMGLAHFLGLLIGVQNPASMGVSRQDGGVQKPGKELGPKTALLDGLG